MPEGAAAGSGIRVRREFEHCDHKWHKSVPLDAPYSDCYTCRVNILANDKWLRQFDCCDHIWYAWVSDGEPYSTCHRCDPDKNSRVEAVPRGEEKGVGACTFQCCAQDPVSGETCGKVYVVLCKLEHTAMCYRCRRINSPIPELFAPRRRLHRRSSDNHGCSECGHGSKENCPNKQKKHTSASS